MAFGKEPVEPVKRSNAQRSLLAVAMLGVLLIAVAVAWYLVRVRTLNPERNGAAIIAEIHALGLDHYWNRQSERLFYFARDEERRPAGWSVVMHGRTDDQHVGWRVDRAGNREVWTLNDSASQGEYEGPTASHGSSLTRISLKDQKVAVEWLARDGSSLGKTPPTAIGAGYIPEGLTPLVIRLVMQKGQDASFTTILNEESIVNGQVNFSAVKMSPKGRMVQVQTQTYKGPLVAQYFLDEKGRVTGIKQGNGELIMVTGDDLLRRFPDDKPLRGLAEEPEVPLTPE